MMLAIQSCNKKGVWLFLYLETLEYLKNFFFFQLKDESSFDADFALRHAKKKKLEVTSLDDKISKIRTEKKVKVQLFLSFNHFMK